VKRVAIIFCALLVFGVACVLALFYLTRPPNEAKLKQSFATLRSSFKEQRKLLQGEPGSMQVRQDGRARNVPGDRARRYVELMRSIPAIDVSRRTEESGKPLFVITLWASGFAGDTVHSGICWTDASPLRQVSSLDAFLRDPESSAGTGWVFQRVEEKWYAWTDLRTRPSP
jgi:hypothetical protein